MSVSHHQDVKAEDIPILEKLELEFMEIEMLVRRYAKDDGLKKHALLRLLECSLLCKESVKREQIDYEQR
jgi:hypothetical protein